MTYLELVNQVLMRLREDKADKNSLDSNPYFAVIGAAVNDAKTTVEDAWEWGVLRTTKRIQVIQGESIVRIPDSRENSFKISHVLNADSGYFMRPEPLAVIERQYMNDLTVPREEAQVSTYGFYPNYWNEEDDTDPDNGLQQIRLGSPANTFTNLVVHCSGGQAQLTEPLQRMRVPAAPVYLLATALASRERGETGGLAVGELLGLAKSALSDAIAIDTTRFPDEMVWTSMGNMAQTNWSTS